MEKAIKVVLLDIEGTTTPISFVAENLFPYVRRELENYLKTNWDAKEVQEDVEQLRLLMKKDQEDNVKNLPIILDAKKSTALKRLQGHMWRKGYETGELKGEIFPDVLEAFEKWKGLDVPIFIYSSGSIEAQKLLFGFSTGGDLLSFFRGHFDTTSGLKVEAASYKKIHEEISKQLKESLLDPSSILFVTDILAEANAARAENLSVALSIRPGNKPLDRHDFPQVTSLLDLWNLFNFS